MKTKLFLIIALIAVLTPWLRAQQPGWNWAKQTSGAPNGYNFSNTTIKTASDNQGNLITAGYSSSRIFLNDTMLFPSGTEFPNTHYSYLWKQDEFSNTVFIKKFDGIVLAPASVACDIYNNIYLWADIWAPTVFEDVPYNSTEGDLLIKFDPQGNVIWVQQHIWGDVAVAENGICFFSGYFTGTKTIGGQTLTSIGRGDMYIAKLDQNGDWLWAKQFGTAAGDERCYQVAPLSNGECFIAGKASSSCDFDGLSISYFESGLFIAKLDSDGSCVWVKGLGSDSYQIDEYFSSICSNNPDVVYIFYQIRNSNNLQNSGVYVYKLNLNVWWPPVTIFHIPATSDVRCRKMVMDNTGNLYLCGYYYDPFTIGGYSYPWENGDFIFKLSGAGNILWSYDHGQNVADSEYNILYYNICVSYQGITYITMQPWEVRLVQPFYTYPGRGSYVLRLSATGQPEWLTSNWINIIGTEAKDICRIPSGDAFVCGDFEGDSFWGNTFLKNRGTSGKDIFVTRFNAANQPVWTVCAGGEADQEVSAIYTDANACSYVTGKYSGTMHFGDLSLQSSGEEDIFVAKLDAQGNWLWAYSAGGQGNDAGLDLVCDTEGNVYACGYFTETADFTIDTLHANGATDGFLVKLNSLGTCLDVVQSDTEGSDQATALAIDNFDRLWLGGNAVPDGNSPETRRITISRLSRNLDILDSICSNHAENLFLSGLSLDNANSCYLTGTYRDEFSFGSLNLPQQPNISTFVLCIDSELQTPWANCATSANSVVPKAITADENGNCYIAGSIVSGGWFGSINVNGWGENDIFVAKLNNSGAWAWAKTNGSLMDDYATGIAMNPNGLCSVIGRFDGRISMGPYWLEPMNQYDSFFGELSYSSDTPEEPIVSPTPNQLSLSPNPFRDNLKISCEVSEPENLEIAIYNLKGQKVRSYDFFAKSAGTHSLVWDGMDSNNGKVGPGIYLIQVKGTKTRQIQKVIKLRG
jgi:hypothetical protein